jgi:transposase
MSTSFRPYHPDQPSLFPANPRDWLAEDHLAYFIADTVSALDLRAFYAPYEGDGRRKQPYEPVMMISVLLYGYATGVFSSREIARKLQEDVAFRVLCGGNYPAHRTICEFRRRHLADFEKVFVQLIRIAQEVGLVKLGTVAIDGTKIKANASKHKAMSYGRMREAEKQLKHEIRLLTRRAEEEDAREDGLYGRDGTDVDIPAELSRRETRLAAIRAAKERLEARQREEDQAKGRSEDDDQKPSGGPGRPYKRKFGEPAEKTQDNFTDPESRIMKTSGGFDQCYNSQIVVDEEARLIVAMGVTQCAADTGQLRPMLDKVRHNLKGTPRRALADAGYASEANMQSLERRGIDGYVAQGRGDGDPQRIPSSNRHQAMARKLRTKRGSTVYRKRKHIAEPPFGWIKSVLGFRQFSVRGLAKVTGEWSLVCLAVNLRRLNGLMAWQT